MSTTNSELASTAFPIVPSPPASAPDHQAVVAFTQQLFGQLPSVESDVDPETSEPYFVVTAPARGSVEELVALNHQWHCNLRSAVGDLADQYRLSIDPQ